MFNLRQTETFRRWFEGMDDHVARRRINARLARVEYGNLGDYKPVGGGVMELRVDYGPGYRVYFAKRGKEIILLLCGGDKSTQQADIRKAKKLLTSEGQSDAH